MCTCTCRIFLFAINIVVGLAGFLLMLFGSLMSWGKVVVREQLSEHIGPFVQRIYGSEVAEKVSHLTELVLRFTAPFGLVVFGFGTAILILCIFGCCGACGTKTNCLKIYTALLLLITFAEITMLAFYYTNRTVVFLWTRKLLEQSLLQYKSFESDDPHSVLFNVMMASLNCCGLEDGNDFADSTNFIRKTNITGEEIELKFPVACCKMDTEFQILNDTCPSNFTDLNSNHYQGCWGELYPHLVFYGNAMAIVGIIVMLFQVLLVTMSVVTLAVKQM